MMDLEIIDPSNQKTYIVKTSKEYYDSIQSNDEVKTEFLNQLFHKENTESEAEDDKIDVDGPKKKIWEYSDTMMLIGFVQDFESELGDSRQRKFMWTQIMKLMQQNNINVTFRECCKKWQNLVRTYRHVKKNKGKTNRFSFYHQMDEILGDKPQQCSPEAIDVKNISSNVVENAAEVIELNHVPNKRRKFNLMQEHTQLKTAHIKAKLEKLKYKKESRAKMEKILNRKLDLEERKVIALEKLVKLKQEI